MSIGESGQKPESITDDEVINAIYQELDRTVEFGQVSLSNTRRKAWNAFLNRPRGDEIAGRSKVQDTSIRDTVHSLLAAIMPAYATSAPISFQPDGPADIDQAAAESAAVNSLFTATPNAYLELRNAVQDALLFRNAVMRVWIDERRDVQHRAFAAPKLMCWRRHPRTKIGNGSVKMMPASTISASLLIGSG